MSSTTPAVVTAAGPITNGDPPMALERAAPSRTTLIRAIAPIDEILAAQAEITMLVTKAFTRDVDFGTIKGTKKDTLYKAGAERICRAFGCVPSYEIMEYEAMHDAETQIVKKVWFGPSNNRQVREEEDVVLGFYRYVMLCTVTHLPTGNIVGSGIGSCSTVESKYQDRPRDLENTIIKMACKRALVAAALNSFGLSDRFTQDIEDAEPEPEPTPAPPPFVPVDSVATADPLDTLPPAGHKLGARTLRDWTAQERADWFKYMSARPAIARKYPIFFDALTAVQTADAPIPTGAADGQATD